jgi:hypothetical protein
MKVTKYFQFRRLLADRKDINDEWIKSVIKNPSRREVQEDGRIRLWAPIKEAGGKYLRVVVLEDEETVHNAFFDRSYKE